ncbi:unnamed protein product [Ilex paraguariensis]|uniref:Glycosyltransferase n=1 Tax=Ilex paraguariensis TaxID=185542 RepID=A0ABC8QYT8_9AQUA
MADKGIHVLMVTLPMQGHITPMLRFAKRLASKGLHVTLATTEVAEEEVVTHIISTIGEENPKIHVEFFSDGLSLDTDRDKLAHLLLMDSLPIRGSKNLSNLITNLAEKDIKFSCIINQPFVPWVADVAADQGIPCAMLFIQAFSLYSIYCKYHKGLKPPPLLENPIDFLEVPGLPLLEEKDLPTFILPSSPYHFRKLVSDSVKSLEKVKWVLVNSFSELETDVLQSMDSLSQVFLLPVGPLVPSLFQVKEDNAMTKDSCLQWLDNKPPSSVIYIAFGSITVLDKKQMENIAMALKKSTRPFLWVVRTPERDSEDKIAELPLGFLEETKERGLVVSWCCQERVLMHLAVACFMSHCGWNSTLEAVVAGVPTIGFPGWTDQPTNAKLVVDVFKMGVRMLAGEDGVVRQEEVERCIAEVTEGPRSGEMKKRAMELKEAARKAVAEGGSSDRNIDQFIDEITGQTSKTLTMMVRTRICSSYGERETTDRSRIAVATAKCSEHLHHHAISDDEEDDDKDNGVLNHFYHMLLLLC